MRSRTGWTAAAALVATLTAGSVTAAAAPPTEATSKQVDEAKRRYAEGHAKFLAGHYEEALALLVQSNALVPSPNSGLLIARCLLELGRMAESYEKFADVERAALDSVRDGEARYAETAAAAAKEKNLVRARIALLDVRGAPGVSASVDGNSLSLSSAGEAKAAHDPGEVRVVFRKDGYEDAHAVTAEAGAEILVTYRPPPTGPAPLPGKPAPEAPARESESRRVPWYGYVTGGVALAGLGTFAGFGIASESKYSDLESRCAPTCSAADRDDADAGRRFQTIANVGLVVGLVALAATAVIVLVR